jgi:hypothetical protein
MRHPFWGGWFGGPATRRLETSQRDAKTDVWMVWLQALSSVAILLVDMGLLAGWLYLVPHWVIYMGITIGFLLGPPGLITLLVAIVRSALMTYLKICDIQPPGWNWKGIVIFFAGMGQVAGVHGALTVPLMALSGRGWCHSLVTGEFPGRTLAPWIYLCYAGINIAFIIGTATAFFRWWGREVPDPVLPEIRQQIIEEPPETKMWLPTWGRDSQGEIHKRQGETEREMLGRNLS